MKDTEKSYKDRLLEAMQESEYDTPTKLAKRIGCYPQGISNVLNESTGKLNASNHSAACEALNVSSKWLATGEGPKRPLLNGLFAIGQQFANVVPGPDLRGKVPLISWVQAGAFSEAADYMPPGEAEEWLDCPKRNGQHTYALRVRGDSMTAPHGKTYPDGCIIFVDPEKRSPVTGERIIAKLDGSAEVTFKVFVQDAGRTWLKALNPQYPPIMESFRVLGTVIGKWEDE